MSETLTEQRAGAPPYLSRAERDRRYRAIEQRMHADGLDALVLPASANRWEQSMADSRYVTGIGGFGTETLTVVPRGQAPTAYVFNRAAWWRSHPARWVDDVRDGRNRWADNVIERLREQGFSRGRIGLSGLRGQTRTPDGVIPAYTMETLRSAFPQAEVVDATALVQDLRSVKSPEEVATLERAAAITDAMVATMLESARPGVTERAVYAALINAMIVAGGDLPSLLIFGAGPGTEGARSQFVPTNRVLETGDLLVSEVEGRYAGYGAQTVPRVWLGRPDPRYLAASEANEAVFADVLGRMRPGATMRELTEAYHAAVQREGKGAFVGGHPLMHARGLGDEVPAILDARDLEQHGNVQVQENMVFVLKPRVVSTDGNISAQIGDTVVVTPSGGRRLGKRSLGLNVI